MKVFLGSALACLMLCPPLFAEIVILKNGKVFEGEVTDTGDALKVSTEYGDLTIDKADVDKVVKDVRELLTDADRNRDEARKYLAKAKMSDDAEVRNATLGAAIGMLYDALDVYDRTRRLFPGQRYAYLDDEMRRIREAIKTCRDQKVLEPDETSPLAVYEQRAEDLGKEDAEGHYLLALWCREQDLVEEMQDELELVIEIDPDHADARRLLGFEKKGDKWVLAGEEPYDEEGPPEWVDDSDSDPLESQDNGEEGDLESKSKEELLEVACSASYPDVRCEAIELLQEHLDRGTVEVLCERLLGEEAEAEVRRILIATLQKAKARLACRYLKKALDGEDVPRPAQFETVEVLAGMDDKDANGLLFKFFAEGDSELSSAAASALKQNFSSIPVLAKALGTRDDVLRGRVIMLLGEIEHEDAAYALTTLLRRGNKYAPQREAAYAALEDMKKSYSIPGLIRGLRSKATKGYCYLALRNRTLEYTMSSKASAWDEWWRLNRARIRKGDGLD